MDRGPGRAIPGTRSPQAADQARSGPRLAHSHRERSAEPLPDTHQTRYPGTPEPGLTWGFEWQVLGSNQRRLSRGFYRELPTKITYSLWPAEHDFYGR
jgi:hypothetical protein